MKTEIKAACSQWHHTQWGESFYPEDLPSDWQLDYYSNEFSALLLMTPEQLNAELIACLEDSLSDEFQVYVIHTALDTKLSSQLLEKEAVSELQCLILLSEFKKVEGFSGLSSATYDDSQLENSAENSTTAFYFYHTDDLLNPKQIRALAEYVLQDAGAENRRCSEGREITVFFSDSPSAIENSRNLQILSQLL